MNYHPTTLEENERVIERIGGNKNLANVFLVENDSQELLAVKQIHIMNANKLGKDNAVRRQIKICSQISKNPQQYIVKIRKIKKNDRNYEIYMDYHKQTLLSFMRSQKQDFKKQTFMGIRAFLNILYGKIELNLTHRDYKLDNFLVKPGQGFLFKVLTIDLGEAKQIYGFTNSFSGNEYYMDPTIDKNQNYNQYDDKVDIWSLGTILYQLFYGFHKKESNWMRLPYSDNQISPSEYREKIIENEQQDDLQLQPKRVPKEINDLIRKMLKKQPCNRFTFNEVMEYIYQHQNLFQYFQEEFRQTVITEFYEYYFKHKKNEFYRKQNEAKFHKNKKLIEYKKVVLPIISAIDYKQNQSISVLQFVFGIISRILESFKWFKETCDLKRSYTDRILSEEEEECLIFHHQKIELYLTLFVMTTQQLKQNKENGYFQKILKDENKRSAIKRNLKRLLREDFKKIQSELYEVYELFF